MAHRCESVRTQIGAILAKFGTSLDPSSKGTDVSEAAKLVVIDNTVVKASFAAVRGWSCT